MALSKEDRAFVMSLNHDTITYPTIEKTFCNHFNVKTKKYEKARISFQEEFELQPGEYFGLNKEKLHTNCGQWILNNALYGNCEHIRKLIGYKNIPFTKGVINDIESQLVKEVAAGKISPKEYADYLNNIQWFGNTFNAAVAPSFTPGTTKILPEIKKEKDALYKKYQKEIDSGDVIAATKISDALVKKAKKDLKNNVGMQLYDSGAKPKFGNNYRAMFVSKGVTYNAAADKFDNTENAFSEGLKPKDIPAWGNGVINGAYPKAIATSVAGYETKKLFASYQAITAGKKGSDCGSKMYRTVLVTPKNKDRILYRYYLKGNKLDLITTDNVNSLVGKTIKLRSPLYCTMGNGHICNKCLGDMPYILGVTNVGLITSSVGSGLLNLLMKAFHDTTQKLVTLDVNKLIID